MISISDEQVQQKVADRSTEQAKVEFKRAASQLNALFHFLTDVFHEIPHSRQVHFTII